MCVCVCVCVCVCACMLSCCVVSPSHTHYSSLPIIVTNSTLTHHPHASHCHPLPLHTPLSPITLTHSTLTHHPHTFHSHPLPSPNPLSPVTLTEPGCFHRLCHCDPAGHWWKPHKAGPCMAVLLVIGWILFLLFFGWAVAIFMLFGLLLLGIMYLVNFICTCSCTDPFN